MGSSAKTASSGRLPLLSGQLRLQSQSWDRQHTWQRQIVGLGTLNKTSVQTRSLFIPFGYKIKSAHRLPCKGVVAWPLSAQAIVRVPWVWSTRPWVLFLPFYPQLQLILLTRQKSTPQKMRKRNEIQSSKLVWLMNMLSSLYLPQLAVSSICSTNSSRVLDIRARKMITTVHDQWEPWPYNSSVCK